MSFNLDARIISPDHVRLKTLIYAISTERERCAVIVEAMGASCWPEATALLTMAAAAIRDRTLAE